MGILLLILYFAYMCSVAYILYFASCSCNVVYFVIFNSIQDQRLKRNVRFVMAPLFDFSIYEDVSLVGLDSMTKKVLTTMLFFLPYNKVSWTSMEVLFAENTNTVYQITHSTGLQPPWKREERWKEKQWDCWGYIGNPRRCKAPPEKELSMTSIS